jgi:hypothetical protein
MALSQTLKASPSIVALPYSTVEIRNPHSQRYKSQINRFSGWFQEIRPAFAGG